MLKQLIADYPQMRATYGLARRIVDAYPASDGARVLREMLQEIGDEKQVLSAGFLPKLKRRYAAMNRKRAAKPARTAARPKK